MILLLKRVLKYIFLKHKVNFCKLDCFCPSFVETEVQKIMFLNFREIQRKIQRKCLVLFTKEKAEISQTQNELY